MNKKAFTLVEVLLAMTVVGIIAVVTMNSLSNISANKTKMTFQNNYKHMIEVIDAIVTDETIYPRIELDSLDINGRTERVTMCNYDSGLFPREFVNHTKVMTQTEITGGFSFETSTGSFWVVRRNPEQANCSRDGEGDYVIIFDVNGRGEGTDCPYTGADLSTESEGTCSNPDTFKFFLGAGTRTVVMDDALKYNSSDLYNYTLNNNYLNFNY